jgi:hypothetical protein
MSNNQVDEKALAFFNRLSGRLKIELTEMPAQVSPRLSNLVASPSARVVNVSLRMRVFEDRGFRELTDGEWSLVVLRAAGIRMRNDRVPEVVVEHAALDGKAFTIRELASAVEETERRARGSTEWFGGVDVHHVHFEGIHPEDHSTWSIHWGS